MLQKDARGCLEDAQVHAYKAIFRLSRDTLDKCFQKAVLTGSECVEPHAGWLSWPDPAERDVGSKLRYDSKITGWNDRCHTLAHLQHGANAAGNRFRNLTRGGSSNLAQADFAFQLLGNELRPLKVGTREREVSPQFIECRELGR